jgi:hypothetical protein
MTAPTLRVNRVIRHPKDLREGMFIDVGGDILYVTDLVESDLDGEPMWLAYSWDGEDHGVAMFGASDSFTHGLAVKQIVPPRFVDPSTGATSRSGR